MSAHNADAKALEMGLDLSTNPPLANYVPAVRTGNLVYLSRDTDPSRTVS